MTRHVYAIALSAAMTAAAGWFAAPGAPALVIEPPPPAPEALPLDTATMALPIKRGSTIGVLLGEQGLPAGEIRAAAMDIYDLARIRPDRDLSIVYVDGQAEPQQVRYAIDSDRTVVVERTEGGWTAGLDQVTYESSLTTLQIDLNRSLWADSVDAGLAPEDIARLAQIFEYELDFNSELQAGASFALVAEVRTSATRTRLGDIHAVRLINNGKEYAAVHHRVGDKEMFYHPDGTGMRRPFLRSPLAFGARVTSSFNPNRFHPILKKKRPHNGTDFGAPTGTKVRTVADGLVTYAARNGGHGNYVKIKHDNGYETSYSHLSRISVKKGQRVSQGTLVGKVGSTGMSTGPHLHYQMWRNGRYVDAMKTRMPNSAPLPSGERAAFKMAAATWLPMLDEPGAVVDAE